MEIILEAEQDKHNSPHPQGGHTFPHLDFIEFTVTCDEGKKLQLATYRYPTSKPLQAVVLMYHGYNSYVAHGSHIAH